MKSEKFINKKINLLIITHCFPSNENDLVGNFLYDFSKHLTEELNVSVKVFTPKMCYDYDLTYINRSVDNIEMFDWKGGEKRLSELKLKKINDVKELLSIFIDGKKSLKKYLMENEFDFILAPWIIPNGYYISSLAKKNKIPFALWALGSDINVYGKKPILNRLVKNAINRSSLTFVNSIGLYNDIKDRYNKKSIMLNTNRELPKSSTKYISLNSKERLKNYKLKLIFIGRLEQVKGPLALIDAIHLSKINNFELTIIGEGSLKSNIISLSNSYKISDKVKLLGNKNSKEIANYLKESDYLVISSESEGMPVVFWEAMQTGTPVISTDVGDIKYYCNKYNVGRVAKKNNLKDLGDLISFIYNFKELRDELSKKTLSLSEKVNIKRSAEKFHEMMIVIVGQPNSSK